jgi:polar amino acid transport system substrate-binding protein
VFAFGNDVLKVSGAVGWYPLLMEDENGVFGVTVDILEKVAAKNDMTLEVVTNLPWKRVLNDAILGNIDVVCGAYYTEERAEQYIYSDPFMQNETRIFMEKGRAFMVNSLEDLIGKKGGMPFGGSFGEEFDTYKTNLDIDDGSKSNEIMFKKLIADRIDYALADIYDGVDGLKQMGLYDQIVVGDYVVSSIEVYFLVSKSTSHFLLQEKINETLDEMKASGELELILKKYQ